MAQVYGLDEQGIRDLREINRWFKGSPRNRPPRRPKWPVGVGGGQSLVPFLMQEVNAYWRSGAGESPVGTGSGTGTGTGTAASYLATRVIGLESTGVLVLGTQEETINFGMFNGVHVRTANAYGGDQVWCLRFNGEWYAMGSGISIWTTGLSQEAFDDLGRVELYSGGPIVECTITRSIEDSTPCDVAFDDVTQQFKVIAQDCALSSGTGTGTGTV